MQTIDNSKIDNAKIEWRDGQPYASTFQDVYFSSDNGLLETEHVFLQGNDLEIRWQQLNAKSFTIVETGFGTGLNFLCAAKLWLETAPEDAVLYFVSAEKHPLNLQDITNALRLWPELKVLSSSLLNNYENLLSSPQTIMLFDNRVQLRLLIGDATARLKTFNLPNLGQQIDAWFLDGFSPAKNPEMWMPELFVQMARLSNHATTFATFTSAGAVRRGLLAAGFNVLKRSGFGKKREMLTGKLMSNANGM